MIQPGRKFTGGSVYRYGFNGKEKDNSTGESNLDFGARIYDGRLGRWLSVDPLQAKYPSFSPYVFAINNPIIVVDHDGRDIIIVTENSQFRLAKSTLLKTATGRELWNKYANSKTTDIYIAISSSKIVGADAVTSRIDGTSMVKMDISLGPDKKIVVKDKITVDTKESSDHKAFDGLDITKSRGKKIFVISLDKEAFSTNATKQKERADIMNNGVLEEVKYDLAESIFHEMKSHIDLTKGGTAKEDHDLYGKAVNGVFRTDKYKARANSVAEKIMKELKVFYDKEIEAKKTTTETKVAKDSIKIGN
jgi:RHS repeat-associated protein